jgi:hypothetical protein
MSNEERRPVRQAIGEQAQTVKSRKKRKVIYCKLQPFAWKIERVGFFAFICPMFVFHVRHFEKNKIG